MDHRIEPVETYPSLFRWAATYSLLLTDDSLYVIRVGPAMGVVGGAEGYLTSTQQQLDNKLRRDELAGRDQIGQRIGSAAGLAMAAPLVHKAEARYGKQVAEGFARLEAKGHRALAKEKGSFRFALEDVTSFKPGKKGALDTMKLKTSGRDFQFKIIPGGADDLRAFAAAVHAAM